MKSDSEINHQVCVCGQEMTKIGRMDTQPFMLTDYVCENRECFAYIDIKKVGNWKSND
jgi:hypothetical protein